MNESIRLAGSGVDAAAPLRSLGQGYVALLDRRFPRAGRVINKRPDNVALHRSAARPVSRSKIHRDASRATPLDTCLSIFFQQLVHAAQLPSQRDLGDIAHHLRGCRELVRHWKALFPEQILEVQYEELVDRPEQTLEEVCGFLGVAW